MLIPLENITSNPWQTRQTDDQEYIEDLAKDIAANSLLQTPLGRLIDIEGNFCTFDLPVNQAFIDDMLTVKGCRVQLAFGHNRLAAFRLLAEQDSGKDEKVGYDYMPVDVRNLTDEQIADYAWSENEKRRDHTPVERALAIQKRLDDFKWTQVQVAEHLGISRPAVSNALRLLKLPEDMLGKLSKGDVSERVAMALVSLFDLPQSLRDKAEQHWGDEKPSVIVKEALAGEITSDEVRNRITEICSRYGKNLQDAEFGLNDAFEGDTSVSPTCRACEVHRIKERNVCLWNECYEYKQRIAIQNYLEKASQVCSIKPMKEDHGHQVLSTYEVTSFEWSNREYFSTIRASGCANLRLMYDKPSRNSSGKTEQRVEGFLNALIVCSKREQFCNCLKGLKATEEIKMSSFNPETREFERHVEPSTIQISSDQPTAEELKELAKTARREKREANQLAKAIVQEVAERIATGLAMKNKATWEVLAHKLFFNPPGGTVWDMQVAIGKHIAEKDLPYEINHIQEVIYKMNILLKACGLQPLDAPPEDRILEQQARAEAEESIPQAQPLIEVLSEQEMAR